MPRERRTMPWTDQVNGVYYVYWYDEAEKFRTRRLSLGTSDGLEAQKRYAKFLLNGVATFSNVPTDGLSVSRVLDDYWREHCATKIVDKDRVEDIIVHLKAWFKDTDITKLGIPDARAYADARRTGAIGGGRRRKVKTASDSTIRRELVVLGSAANHAAKWRRIGPNADPPTAMPVLEKPAEDRHEAIYLTEAELAEVLRTAPAGRVSDFMHLLYYTAARRASIERMTRFQVDLKRNRINLSSPKESAVEKRSAKRRPWVPIDPAIRPIVERLMMESTGSEWLFGDDRDMYRPHQEHLIACGFPEKANPHVFRHSRATHLLQAGVEIYAVAKLLGDTTTTVERVYGHHCPEYLGETIKGTKR